MLKNKLVIILAMSILLFSSCEKTEVQEQTSVPHSIMVCNLTSQNVVVKYDGKDFFIGACDGFQLVDDDEWIFKVQDNGAVTYLADSLIFEYSDGIQVVHRHVEEDADTYLPAEHNIFNPQSYTTRYEFHKEDYVLQYMITEYEHDPGQKSISFNNAKLNNR